MIGETPDAAKSALAALSRLYDAGELAAIEDDIIADAEVYSERKDKTHLKLEGGRDGVRMDYGVSLEELRERNRRRLGLPLYAEGDYPENAVRVGVLCGPRWNR